MNILKPNKRATIETLLEAGVSQHEIHRKTKIDRKTIRKYGKKIVLMNTEEDNSKSPIPATGTVDSEDQNPPPRPPAGNKDSKKHEESACEPHREWIEKQVNLGRNAMSIFQDLVEKTGFTHKYNSVKRFVRRLRRNDPRQHDRLEFLPGEEVQVDYGEGAKTLHSSGRYRKPRLFVMTLRYSRRCFRKVVWKSSQETWARLHEEAFRYFGGCPQYVVLDNLKEGVIHPDIYEPELNSVYSSMLFHYGVVADPARVNDPDRKGSVENAIQHTQNTALKGRVFESIESQNEWLMHWEERWAAPRIHGSAKRQVEQMYQEEKPYLKPLPIEPFRYYRQESRRVWDDGAIQVDSSFYSALPAALHSDVIIRIYEAEIEIYDPHTMDLIRRHPKSAHPGQIVMNPEDRIFNPSRQTMYLLAKAEKVGPWTMKLCQGWFSEEGRPAQRRIQGVVSLVRQHESCHIEHAAHKAVEMQLNSYKAFRRLVESLAEESKKCATDTGITQEHCLIRPGTEYQSFFDHHASGIHPSEKSQDHNKGNALHIFPNREHLPEIWQNAAWHKVIEVFGLEACSNRRALSDEIWIKSPFSGETTASLHLNTQENIYKDFSSGKGGGILTFCQDLLKHRGQTMDCYQVAQWMVHEGISSWNGHTERKSVRTVTCKTNPLNENRPIQVDLRTWLKTDHPEWIRRGISSQTCTYLGCGYLPMSTNGKSKSPLNGRLVFQIRGISMGKDCLSTVILSHTGRAVTHEQEIQDGKYWCYPFRKGLEIYNQDNLLSDETARYQITQSGLTLVEGFFDVAALIQASCLNTGALMGAHITPEQILRLKHIDSHVPIPFITLFLDRDKAGMSGSLRARCLLQDNGFSVRIFDWGKNRIRLTDIQPHIKDPADMTTEMIRGFRQQGSI